MFLLFNTGTWKYWNNSGFFVINYYNPKEIIIQHVSVKENVFNTRKNKYGAINRFRSGDITQHSTSVDIEEAVRSDGFNIKTLKGFISDNLECNPFERFF